MRDVVGRDDYGRLLAYVFRRDDDLFVNEAIIGGGYARPLTIAPNTAYADASSPRPPPRRPPISASGVRAADSVAPRGTRCGPSERGLVAERAARLLRRREAGDHLVRRPRLVPCRQRGRLPGDPRRRRDVHLAHGAGARGPATRPPSYDPADDIGVHLTLNAEHAMYRWGPITHAPSLLSGDGGFPRSIDDLWEHADPEEVERELRTQIERAMAWGIDVTHLAPHLTAITLRPEFFDIYLDLAVDFRLPIRLAVDDLCRAGRVPVPSARRRGRRRLPGPLRPRLAGRAAGIACSPRSTRWRPASPRSTSSRRSTPPRSGPSSDAAEQWIDDLALALDPHLQAQIDASGATLIGYRELRAAMRDA